MSNYTTLKSTISAYVKQNDTGAITGDGLQSILNQMVNSLGNKYQFVGVAQPNDNPGTPDYNVAYLAGTPGSYQNFGNNTVAANQICILKYNGTWTKEVLMTIPTPTPQPAQYEYIEVPSTDWDIDADDANLTLVYSDVVGRYSDITVPDPLEEGYVNPPHMYMDEGSSTDFGDFVLSVYNFTDNTLYLEGENSLGLRIAANTRSFLHFTYIAGKIYLISKTDIAN